MSIQEIQEKTRKLCQMEAIAKNYAGRDNRAACHAAAETASDEELNNLAAQVEELNEAENRFNNLHWEIFGCEPKAPWQIGA